MAVTISNVALGSGPGLNDGDSVYTAFYKTNQNFANVQSNVNALSSSVTKVANRTGNVVLTIADINGLAGSYATYANITTANLHMKGYVDGQITASNVFTTTANIGMKGYVDLANTSMKSYVDQEIFRFE